jgi:hypothetical protein
MSKYKYTIPENPNPQYSNEEGTFIDIDVFFPLLEQTVRYTSAEKDPGWEHSEEIFRRALDGEFGPIAPYVPLPPEPNYLDFWNVLVGSTIYTAIREQSFTSLPMNTLATEFIALIGDAKVGRPNESAIQSSINAILATGTFTEEHLNELQEALESGHLQDIYTLSQ